MYKKEENCCGHSHEHEHNHSGKCWCGHDHNKEERVMAEEKACSAEEFAGNDDCGCADGEDDEGGDDDEGHHHEHLEEHHHHNHCCDDDDDDDCCCGEEHHRYDHCCEYDDCCEEIAANNVFTLKNLGCAHCASKMEEKIKHLPDVKNASITFVTKELRIDSSLPASELLPEINKICKAIEPEVEAVVKQEKTYNDSDFKIYTIKNLDCAHCAAKMERLINEMDGVDEAVISFTSKQLRLKAENADKLMPEIKKACRKIESEIDFSAEENSSEEEEDEKSDIIKIAIGAVIFAGIQIYSHVFGAESFSPIALALLVVAYIVLGGDVIITSLKNIRNGQIFDENFLMSVATLGAFAIKEYPEAVGVMLFFKIGELFEHIAVKRSRSQIMDAVDLRPETVNVVENGEIKVKDAKLAKAGDILLVRPGDRIPLDGEVLEGESRIDTSAVTGESVPVKAEKGSKVISGCVNVSAVIKIKAEKELKDSMVTRILNSVENAAAGKPKIDSFITRFARVYTPIVVFAALFTAFAMPLITGQGFYKWIYTALSFLVMSCPCALVLSVPLAFFCGIGSASKRGILFKGGIVMESLASIKAVVMDKTGTITKGNFDVSSVKSSGYVTEGELLKICASCESTSTHPIAESIVKYAKEKNADFAAAENVEELSGMGIKAVYEGRNVFCGNKRLMDKFNVSVPSENNETGGTEVIVAVDGKYAGRIVISDTIKEEAKSAIGKIKKQNIVTAMLTGDTEKTAEAVAKTTGIDELHAKLMPEDKLNELKNIRNKHGEVMFVGDGINDAPVLAGADVGAAMGSGADAAIEAADVVFMKSNMESIPDSIAISKKSVAVSRQNVVFAIAVKAIVLILGITGIYSNMWLAVFADTGVALICILNSVRILYSRY